MPTFPDNSGYLAKVNGEPLELPLRGRVFRFAGSPPITEGSELHEMRHKILAAARGEIPETTIIVKDQRALYVRLCGDQYDALVEHGINESELALVGATLLNTYLYGLQAGMRTWTGELQKQVTASEAKPTKTTAVTSKAKRKPPTGGRRTTTSGISA